jgi:hypothetical protein
LKIDFEKAYDTVNWDFSLYMFKRCGFPPKLIDWMRSCLCSGDLSVLVNGCPSEQVSIKKGLKQGDPLAPFVFLLVAKGLAGLVRMVELGELLDSFSFGERGPRINLLQYADDTILVGEATEKNLWAWKAMLRAFELVSGLKVNLAKSCLYGINVEDRFIDAASTFLSCKVGSLPFSYLGLPIGANPRKRATWDPVIQCIEKKLGSWKNKYVSLGGRVTLINSVLNSIPIYYASFLKMPRAVSNQIMQIQRSFLWMDFLDPAKFTGQIGILSASQKKMGVLVFEMSSGSI